MQTILALDDFRKHITYNPWHFWQLASQKVPAISACDPIVRQYGWQNAGAAGRAEVIDGLYQAERILTTHLGFAPGLNYVTESMNIACWQHSYNDVIGKLNGLGRLIKLDQGKVKKIATLSLTQLDPAAAVARSDKDSDTLKEYFEIILPFSDTSVALADIVVYFSTSDWLAEWGQDDAQVRPVKVTRQDANNIKISGASWLLVKPYKYQGVGTVPGYDPGITGQQVNGSFDPSDDNNYVTTLAVFKQVWSDANKISITKNGTTAAYDIFINDMGLELGQITLGLSNCQLIDALYCTCCNNSQTDVTINYQAGDTSIDWSKEISRLALAELDKPLCGCTNLEVARWQRDRAETTNPTAGFRIDNNQLGNPLGTREGQIYAWLRVKEKRLLTGIMG